MLGKSQLDRLILGGDFAFSAESGTVWMYESSWYNSGQLVPDQVTPACDELPIVNATKFIKTGGTVNDILLANGDTKVISDIDSDSVKKTGKPLQIVQGLLRYGGEPPLDDDVESEKSDDDDYQTRGQIYSQYVNKTQTETITGRKTFKNNQLEIQPTGTPSSFASVSCGNIQINSSTTSYGEGLRIENTAISNLCAIYIRTSHTNTSGEITGQWTIIKRPNGSLTICRTADQNTAHKGLVISADGESLSFNGSVIAGTEALNGASNGSVNYSAGNPILWGVNSTDPIGGFYSDGPKVYWRAHPLTMGSVPP
ncbi:MAG: hypothetical protein EZS28_008972 [Streblomastix strix]|uniref:Uncharacterized protein n=1 Tax=Streblomastix strix TaxID=222440 RepID=A0A5J4WKR0_9EUKA|nr:MAG: hypothetical protein EZS28_008972 [Streblomastix strix]